jgi:hypothetical protein
MDNDILSQIRQLIEYCASDNVKTFIPILPLVLRLKGKNYTIEDYFPFEFIFKKFLPRRLVMKTGRQVSKSTSMAARCVLESIIYPHYSSLIILPLLKQAIRYSVEFIKPFITGSEICKYMAPKALTHNVLYKSFINGSKIHLSHIQRDPEVVRGIYANVCYFDELQDIDPTHIPIVLEVMSGQKVLYEVYSGTPLSLDNAVELKWQDSSKAEWVIKCEGCNHFNIPSLEQDLLKMIGPYREDISEERPAVVCAKCSRPLQPRKGRWIHQAPDKVHYMCGYHVPQIIMPVHYANPHKWRDLLDKMEGKNNYTTAKFYNEVLGESYDIGLKLFSLSELREASTVDISLSEPLDQIVQKSLSNYKYRILGIDWGGGAGTEDNPTSFTAFAVVGVTPYGRFDVIYGGRLANPYEHYKEAKYLLNIFSKFLCNVIAFDSSGAGSVQEAIFREHGLQPHQLIPIFYVYRPTSAIMIYHPPKEGYQRYYYSVDKTRSLLLLAQNIRSKQVTFFKYDSHSEQLFKDFLSLVQELRDTSPTHSRCIIIKQKNTLDDFAHAVNFAVCAGIFIQGNFPNFCDIDRT